MLAVISPSSLRAAVRPAAGLVAQRHEFAAKPRGTRLVHEAYHSGRNGRDAFGVGKHGKRGGVAGMEDRVIAAQRVRHRPEDLLPQGGGVGRIVLAAGAAIAGCPLNLHLCGRAAARITPPIVVIDLLGERLGRQPCGHHQLKIF